MNFAEYFLKRGSLVKVLAELGEGTSGAEVGVYQGELSLSILNMMNPKALLLVDPWELYEDYYNEISSGISKGKGAGDRLDKNFWDNTYKQVVEKFGNIQNVRIIRRKSPEAALLVCDESLDWVYIDGSHTEKSVYSDTKVWYEKVRSGGFLCGHDFSPNFEVPLAVNRFCSERNIKFEVIKKDWLIKKI